MLHQPIRPYRQQSLMTVSKAWTLTVTLLLFITLALLGTRLPKLSSSKTAKPRPASKALIEVPAKALKSLKGYLAGIPGKRTAADQPFTISEVLGTTSFGRVALHRPDRLTEPLPDLFQLLRPSRAPPATA